MYNIRYVALENNARAHEWKSAINVTLTMKDVPSKHVC